MTRVMVKNYRDSIYKTIVPAANRLRERQKSRLGLDRLYYYDLPFRFRTGNPKPEGTPGQIVKSGRKMHH